MFKLPKGNVIQKLNNMNRKQAYTYGGIVVAVVVALILLASFLGNAEDQSFEGFNSRGYDLATSPFVTDEAEEFLLASKYPDMQDNNASTLYSPAEKEARQEEDDEYLDDDDDVDDVDDDDDSSSSSRYSDDDDDDSGSYRRSSSGRSSYSSGGYRGGGSGRRTEINRLGGASMGRGSGSGINSTWGSPRVDTYPFRRREMEKDKIKTETAKKEDARRSLSQFAQGSRAAAGLKDNRELNMKRAIMGGNINGANAFKEDGTVDLSQLTPGMLDTNAPQGGSADFNSLKDATSRAANQAKNDREPKENPWMAALRDFAISVAKNLATNLIENAFNSARETARGNSLAGKEGNALLNSAPTDESVGRWNAMSGQDLPLPSSEKGQKYWTGDKSTIGHAYPRDKKGTPATKLNQTPYQNTFRDNYKADKGIGAEKTDFNWQKDDSEDKSSVECGEGTELKDGKCVTAAA